MSVDELGCVSPQMFREFFTGEINDLSRKYGGVAIHTCADSIRQWENLRQIESLKLMNIHSDKSEIFKAFDFFKKTCAQLHYVLDMTVSYSNITPGEVDTELPQMCRVVLPLEARDLDHAKEVAELFAKYL